jgi:hypothetical protein
VQGDASESGEARDWSLCGAVGLPESDKVALGGSLGAVFFLLFNDSLSISEWSESARLDWRSDESARELVIW